MPSPVEVEREREPSRDAHSRVEREREAIPMVGIYIYIYIRGIADGCGRPTSSAAWPSKGETGEQEPGESRVSVGTMCREGEMGLVSVNSSIGFEAV